MAVLSTTPLPLLALYGRYEKKRVVLHTDEKLMPPETKDWSPLNIVVSPRAKTHRSSPRLTSPPNHDSTRGPALDYAPLSALASFGR